MTTIPSPKYIRTEPPRPLTEDFTVPFGEDARERLNAYRAAYHAWHSAPVDSLERAGLKAVHDEAAVRLASYLDGWARAMQGDTQSDWALV